MEESNRKRFSLFKKKNPTADDSTESYDESWFDFTLKSNNFHTCLIEASAVMKKGKYAGMPLPLNCTWYRATDEKEFVTIDGVTGAFYQPNADDIGCKICVHAVPVSEVQEYIGMPAFSEVGPIQIDPEVQSSLSEILNKNQTSFQVKFQGKIANLVIDREILKVLLQDSSVFSVNLVGKEVKVEINYKINTGFRVTAGDESAELAAGEQRERDFIVICIRSFCSKAQSVDIAEIMVKNQQLSSRLFETNKNYESALVTISTLKEDLQNKQVEILNLKESFTSLDTDLQLAKEELHKFKSQNENLLSETQFLRKDLMVYKEQLSLSDDKLKSFKSEENQLKLLIQETKDDLESLVKSSACSTCRIDDRLYIAIDRLAGNSVKKQSRNSSIYSLQEDTTELEKPKDCEIHSQQIKQIQEEFSDMLTKAEAEKMFYKRKVESLVTDNDKLLSKLGKNPKEIKEFFNEKQEFEQEKSKMRQEVSGLKTKIIELESLVKVNKRKLDAEVNRNFELRKTIENKGVSNNVDYQKIVNSLTQTLTDREAELQSQKKLNKQFMNRISELEAVLSIVHQIN